MERISETLTNTLGNFGSMIPREERSVAYCDVHDTFGTGDIISYRVDEDVLSLFTFLPSLLRKFLRPNL